MMMMMMDKSEPAGRLDFVFCGVDRVVAQRARAMDLADAFE
jgi:hypothetical protein